MVAPQRVTRLDGGDADPCGWTEGTLVRLQVRDGRLTGWAQEPSTRSGVGVSGADDWAAFARRNATLAAALARNPPT